MGHSDALISSLPRLELIHVWKRFGLERGRELVAVQDVSFSVWPNEFVSLLGPSGCGKSTILMMSAGLETLSEGEIRVNGQPIRGPGRERGVVFQTYTLYPWLNVAENVRFALLKSNLSRAEQEERVMGYLRRVGLQEFARAMPNQLSGGMRQRVAIARALVAQPEILLMDEPFGALDAQTRLLMQELLLQVWQQEQTTVLFVTHDVEEAILLSDRIYVMTARPGRIKAEIAIDLPRPRSLLATEALPRFAELRQQILSLLRSEVQI